MYKSSQLMKSDCFVIYGAAAISVDSPHRPPEWRRVGGKAAYPSSMRAGGGGGTSSRNAESRRERRASGGAARSSGTEGPGKGAPSGSGWRRGDGDLRQTLAACHQRGPH
jgi:hypothetical protein